ncbi:hypothetical protein [Streptomyces sp. NPDC001530]|uniref:hypothetical protein n=1 Tax=Streptomyces sp. NPDC001530 TaxID=3364582 RepID=UPI0036C2CB4F
MHQQPWRRTALLVAGLVTAATVTTGAAQASAAPAASEGDTVISISADQFRQARAKSRAADAKALRTASAAAPARERERTSYLRESRRQGVDDVSRADIDVVDLGHDLLLTLPTETDIKSVTVTKQDDGRFSAEVEDVPQAFGADSSAASAASVGTDAGTAAVQGEIDCPLTSSTGQWKLTMLGVGYMYAYWQKCKAGSTSTHDVWVYKRWAVGRPVDVPGDDWSVVGMYLGSYAKPGHESKFLSNIDQQPRTTQSRCDDVFNATVTTGVPGFGVEVSFPIKDCTDYTVSWGSTPGKYSVYMDQGFSYHDGDQEAEYAQAVKIKKGQTPYWSDRQRIEWARWTLPTIPCESVNSNKVCDPNA